jgi:hypothetical protein
MKSLLCSPDQQLFFETKAKRFLFVAARLNPYRQSLDLNPYTDPSRQAQKRKKKGISYIEVLDV